MDEQPRKGELEFEAARLQIERAIESTPQEGQIELPRFSLEKGETRFSFAPPVLEPARIPEAIQILKSHVEPLQVHTSEGGYLVFQSQEPEAIRGGWHSTRYKFITLGSQTRVEVSRRGNFTQDEVLVCLELFRLFSPAQNMMDPADTLRKLGVQVYDQAVSPSESTESTGSNESPWLSIGGYESTIQEVEESILLPLMKPEIFASVARLSRSDGLSNTPRAILFEGPPGVGKTTFARIIGEISGIPLVYVPVENILSKYYGESAQNMAAIFDAAAVYNRAILFLDEIDSLATSREGGMYEATRRVLSVLLRKIDGFDSRDGIMTIGATNRSEDLDSALLSRFDHTIRFPLPELKERAAIFARYANQLSPGEALTLADQSEGISGREIQDVCEYAERRHARKLILENTSASAPPLKTYQDVLAERMARQDPNQQTRSV